MPDSITSHEERIQRLESENKNLRKNLDEFLYHSGHDLNAPLRNISNLATWISEELDSQKFEAVKEYSTLLIEKTKLLESRLSAITNLSQLTTKDLEPNLIHPYSIVEDLVSEYAENHTINLQIQGNAEPIISLGKKFTFTLRQLLDNAVEFSPENDKKIIVRLSMLPSQVKVEIEDNGPGIPLAYREKVSALFYSLHPEKNTLGAGLTYLKALKSIIKMEYFFEENKEGGTRAILLWPKKP